MGGDGGGGDGGGGDGGSGDGGGGRGAGRICWTGIIVGRRLVMVVVYTFVTDPLLRLLSMLLVCFASLLHHVDVQPYASLTGNIAATTSAAGLVALGTINLVRAGFEAAKYTPTGPNAVLMAVLAEIDDALTLWLPICVIAALLLVAGGRLVAGIVRWAVPRR